MRKLVYLEPDILINYLSHYHDVITTLLYSVIRLGDAARIDNKGILLLSMVARRETRSLDVINSVIRLKLVIYFIKRYINLTDYFLW